MVCNITTTITKTTVKKELLQILIFYFYFCKCLHKSKIYEKNLKKFYNNNKYKEFFKIKYLIFFNL